jgi:ribose/xylose/arabinose/galactoside ABC-type transport system permease subunit
LNIFVQCSAVAVVAVGMTFVLLTAGIDLSVGSVMFLSSTFAGVLVVHFDWPVLAVLPVMILCGVLAGGLNGFLIAYRGMVPFIVTLAMLFIARGAGLWITQTRAINLPDEFRQLATARLLGVPMAVVVLVMILVAAHLILTRTVLGRYLYAVGNDPTAASKTGVNVARVQLSAYVLCGMTAGIGGMIILAQLSAVSPNLGQGRELDVIAAAVLGGTSLFGGRGTAAGAVLGAMIVETVRNGMNLMDSDPYSYPIIIGLIIFLAVLLDSLRCRELAKLKLAVNRKRA